MHNTTNLLSFKEYEIIYSCFFPSIDCFTLHERLFSYVNGYASGYNESRAVNE